MVRKRTAKPGTKGSKMHGDVSRRKPSTPADRQIPDPQGGLFQGKNLGTTPGLAQMPQTMQGPAEYPGQELGAG